VIEYALLLAGCLLVTLPLDLVWKLRVYARWRQVARAVAVVAPPFVVWDVLVVDRWWVYNPRYVLRPRIAGLPLEEIAFFVVIPIAAILTWEVVHEVLRDRGDPR
jgi:lycopene cyclase domain-containing protein